MKNNDNLPMAARFKEPEEDNGVDCEFAKYLYEIKRIRDKSHLIRRRQNGSDEKSRTNLYAKKCCRVRSTNNNNSSSSSSSNIHDIFVPQESLG
jgi:hypothetical protein